MTSQQLLMADRPVRASYASKSLVHPGNIRRQNDVGGFEGD